MNDFIQFCQVGLLFHSFLQFSMSKFYEFDLENIILTLLELSMLIICKEEQRGMLNSLTDTCTPVLGCARIIRLARAPGVIPKSKHDKKFAVSQ